MNKLVGRLFFIVFFVAGLSLSASAQPAQSSQPPTSQVAISATTGKEAVCEGGAEIIPSGQQSFVRKRYANPKSKNKTAKTRTRK